MRVTKYEINKIYKLDYNTIRLDYNRLTNDVLNKSCNNLFALLIKKYL